MTASVHRRTSFSRALLAAAGVGVLALLALAAVLLGPTRSAPSHATHTDTHTASVSAAAEHDHTVPEFHAIRQQPSTRARSVAFAVLSSAAVLAAWAFRRVRTMRDARLRTLRITGLPPGRAPPVPRIA